MVAVNQLIGELNQRVAALFERVAQDLRRLYATYWERAAPSAGALGPTRQVRDEATAKMAPMRAVLHEKMASVGLR